jgi:hypothetical protein
MIALAVGPNSSKMKLNEWYRCLQLDSLLGIMKAIGPRPPKTLASALLRR